MQVQRRLVVLSALAALGVAPSVQAHTLSVAHSHGILSGFLHPFLGLDHLLAMIAVGLLAAQHRGHATRNLLLAFLALMAMGAAAGTGGLPLPMLETGLAGSVLALGLLLVWGRSLPAGPGLGMVGAFALLHGYAHGLEMPASASALSYGVGFLGATAVLNGFGFGIGAAARRFRATAALRAAGAIIGVVGGILLWT